MVVYSRSKGGSGHQVKARHKFARPSRNPLILFTDGSRATRYIYYPVLM